MAQLPLVLGFVVDCPAPLVDIVLYFCQQGVEPIVLHRALVQVNQCMAAFLVIASDDRAGCAG